MGWASLGMGDYKPADTFRFVDSGAPVVWCEQRGDQFIGETNAVLVLSNPGATALTVKVQLSLERDVMPQLKEARTVTLAPGATEELAIRVSDQATRKYKLTARVASGGRRDHLLLAHRHLALW